MRKLSQAERTELSDQRMVEAAIAIMLQRGISGLRLTDVGLQAGYSRGLAAMRFGSVGQLLRRVAGMLSERWMYAVREAVDGKRGIAAIFAAIDAQERYLQPPATAVRVQYLILFHSLDPGASDRLNAARVLSAQRRDLARWIEQAIEDGDARRDVDAAVEAASILSAMTGTIFQSLMDPEISPAVLCGRLKSEIAARLAPRAAARRSLTARRRSAQAVARAARLRPG
jgi:AcrR family transcriptional regulator